MRKGIAMDKTIEEIAKKYIVNNDYDFVNTIYAFNIFKNYLKGKTVLEIGSADGVMTEKIVNIAKRVDVVEPSKFYYDIIKNIKGVNLIFNDFIENISFKDTYKVVLTASLLHHIERPDIFLFELKKVLNNNSIVLATVPNMTSLHRQMGVEMGLLKSVYDETERNRKFQQFGRFDLNSFKKLFEDCGYEILESYGYMLKPFSSDIMFRLNLSKKQLNALFYLGKKYQEICSQLFVRAKIKL